ncbi:MAG: hypothetical protein Kow0022_00490 [Phycisphaerales bacterium]
MVWGMDETLLPEEAAQRIAHLRQRLVDQGHLVASLLEAALTAFYQRDAADAAGVAAEDDRVDRVDVEIERESVALLSAAARAGCNLEPSQVRQILTIVKINNELERVADVGTDIAEMVDHLSDPSERFPETTKVMTNSVLGLVRDAVASFADADADRARVVLQSEHVVLEFKAEILQRVEQLVKDGAMPIASAFDLHELIAHCMLIADHCTNIAEQVIYERTGMIVRHIDEAWIERPADPN